MTGPASGLHLPHVVGASNAFVGLEDGTVKPLHEVAYLRTKCGFVPFSMMKSILDNRASYDAIFARRGNPRGWPERVDWPETFGNVHDWAFADYQRRQNAPPADVEAIAL